MLSILSDKLSKIFPLNFLVIKKGLLQFHCLQVEELDLSWFYKIFVTWFQSSSWWTNSVGRKKKMMGKKISLHSLEVIIKYSCGEEMTDVEKNDKLPPTNSKVCNWEWLWTRGSCPLVWKFPQPSVIDKVTKIQVQCMSFSIVS